MFSVNIKSIRFRLPEHPSPLATVRARLKLSLRRFECACEAVCAACLPASRWRVCVVRAAHSREHGHAREVHSAQHHINCCVCYYLQAHTEVCAAPDKDPSAGPAQVQSSPTCMFATDRRLRDSRFACDAKATNNLNSGQCICAYKFQSQSQFGYLMMMAQHQRLIAHNIIQQCRQCCLPTLS